ncbi:LpqN/LpqT family lipoprotein [Cnuibacter sp. UC19_7]|uniref:LpqN/LpqT family lipoprotein n=1 Tax=Cnuibacter sp. UC19_7 TaxID=3350166 RepID=UPI0036706EC6
MTNTITFPGENTPAFPAVALDLPDDWREIVVAGTVLAGAKSVPEGEFRPNVVVALSRFARGYTLDDAIRTVTEKVESIDGAVELGRDDHEVLGRPGFRIEFSYPDPRVGTLMQGVRIAVIEHGAVADLVQITATATGTQATELWGELRDVQSSLSEATAGVA